MQRRSKKLRWSAAVGGIAVATAVMALPFISAGGTHLFLTAAAVGILVSIARMAEDV